MIFLVACGLAAGRADAQPVLTPHVGGLAWLGPATAHPTAIFYNPGALSLLQATEMYFGGNLRIDQGSIDRAAIDPATGQPGPGATHSFPRQDIDFVTLDGFAGLTSTFGRVTVALAAFSPSAEQGTFDTAVSGGAPGAQGPTRYHRVSLDWRDTYFSLGIGTRLTNRIRAGLALSFVFTSLSLAFVRDVALDGGSAALNAPCPGATSSAACGVENAASAQLITVDTAAQGITLTPGIALSPAPDWWLGISYLPPLSYGGSTTSGSASVTGGLGVGKRLTGQSAVIYQMPQRVMVGLRGPIGKKTTLGINATWSNWALHHDLDVRLTGAQFRLAGIPERVVRYRGFQDTYMAEVELDRQQTARWRFGGAARFESSAVPEAAVSAMSLDAPKLDLSLSAEVKLGKLSVVLGYGIILRVPQHPDPGVDDPQKTVACVDSGYDLDVCEDVRLGRGRPTAAGTYSWATHQVSVGLGYRF